MGKGYYADYKPFTVADGEGFRCSLYVSGCTFNCEGCWNKAAQSFRFGKPYTEELQEQILNDLDKPWVQGLSLLGGEPYQNIEIVLPLVQAVRERFGTSKDIWCWTGNTLEEVKHHPLTEYVDVLVDGRYVEELGDTSLPWCGSSNQQVHRLSE